jgi:EAL domain-containing protein (putative c-di-GMP-specific phosphodiesterase class I)
MQGYLFSKPLPQGIFEDKYLGAGNAGAAGTADT